MYRCTECKSEEVEQKEWVDMNTGKNCGVLEEDDDNCWCRKCEELTKFYNDEDTE
jgi:hypothetical protein